MSQSLEERCAERRRRRQMEDESIEGSARTADELHADIQERLARRRKEREQQLASITANVTKVNDEDDLERQLRDRQEGRSRVAEDNTSTDDSRSHPSRGHAKEDDAPAKETPTVNHATSSVLSQHDNTEKDAALEQQLRRCEEEEAQHQVEQEEKEELRCQEAAAEQRRREEEKSRKGEEKEEREYRAERDKEVEKAECQSGSMGSCDGAYKTEIKLFINEDDLADPRNSTVNKLESVQQWNEQEHKKNTKINSDIAWKNSVDKRKDSVGERKYNVGERKISVDKRMNTIDKWKNSEEVDRVSHFQEVTNNKIKDKLNMFEHLKEESETKLKEKVVHIPVEKDGLKGKLELFEKEIKEQEMLAKDITLQMPKHKEVPLQTSQSQKLSEKLQLFESAAKQQSFTKTPNRSVQDQHTIRSPTEKTENLSKRPSGNTEFKAIKFLEKSCKSFEEASFPKIPNVIPHRSSFSYPADQRRASETSQTLSDTSKDWSSSHSKSAAKEDSASILIGEESAKLEQSYKHPTGSSIDEARMTPEEEAAKKKRGKRKGLGGLTPEKKKKLKDFIADFTYTEEEEEEKLHVLSERIPPLPDDLEYLSTVDLKKLIKELYYKLAQLQSESYDMEFKLNKQEQEVSDLNMKISDSRGKLRQQNNIFL